MGNSRLSRFGHSAWVAVVLPLALGIVATFSPEVVRFLLLFCLVPAGTWTFYKTEYAGRSRGKTAVACLIFLVLAVGVFALGHYLDAKKRTIEVARHGSLDGSQLAQPLGVAARKDDHPPALLETGKNTGATPKRADAQNRSVTKNSANGMEKGPGGGGVIVQPGAIVGSIGQQGGLTEVNINPSPEVSASAQEQRKTSDPELPWMTVFTIKASGDITAGNITLRCNGPALRVGIERINPFSFMSGSNGPDPKDANVVIYELSPEPLRGSREIHVVVYSKGPVKVISGSIGSYQIRFPQ